MKNRIVHFEIHATDVDRAIKFYKDVFGWEFTKWEGSPTPYYMVMTAEKGSKEPGINGGLLLRKGEMPKEGQCVNAFVCTVQVDSIDEIIKKVEAGGGTVAMEKFAMAGMAWQAYYKDTEGNLFGIHQADSNAK